MDKITGINTTAIDGIQRKLRELQAAAHEIATAPVERAQPTELAKSLVEMLEVLPDGRAADAAESDSS